MFLRLLAALVGLSVISSGGVDGSAQEPLVEFEIPRELAACGSWEVSLLAQFAGREPGWRLVRKGPAIVDGGITLVRVPAADPTVLLLSSDACAGYLLDGPFVWSHGSPRRTVAPVFRRTVRGPLPEDLDLRARVAWVGRSAADVWPSCGPIDGAEWECVGVPLSESGVVLFPDSSHVTFASAPADSRPSSVQGVSLSRAEWARRLQVIAGVDSGAERESLELRAVRWRVSRWRRADRRLREEPDDGVLVTRLGPTDFWLAGAGSRAGAGVRIAGVGVPDTALPFDGWELGSPEIPHVVQLDSAVGIDGQVLSAAGTPAAGSHVTVSEAVELPSAPALDSRRAGVEGSSDDRRYWRTVTEAVCDAEGRFRLEGLRPGAYEFLAVHPLQGRLLVQRTVGQGALVLRLHPSKQARGVVTRHGLPVAGVPVRTAPDLQQYLTGRDPTEVLGGAALTGSDGQFAVGLPAEGAVQLLIGTPELGLVRRTLGSVASLPQVTELGPIELGAAIRLFVRLDGWDRCELHAAGPFGSSGLTLVTAVPAGPGLRRFELPEPGRWVLTLACGSRELALIPPVIDVGPDTPELVVEVGVLPPPG